MLQSGEAVISETSALRTKLGLRTKLTRVYLLQGVLISLAALVGVFATYIIVEDVLTRQALNDEAGHFWSLHALNPDQLPPDTANLTGYLQQGDNPAGVPAELLQLPSGYSRVESLPSEPFVHISQQGDKRLYLVFAQEQVSSLVFYFGVAPLAAVLLVTYVLLFLTYRLSQQAISPMLNLAQALETFDFRSTDRLPIPVQPDDVDRETRLMVLALTQFSERLERFIERERTFTRNAGHELRTPMAVLKGSLEILLSTAHQRPAADVKVLQRMRKVSGDMELILETLIMLAREEDVYDAEGVDLNSVIAEELEMLRETAEAKGLQLQLQANAEPQCFAKRRVLSIVMGNLLRNAVAYTHAGEVRVVIDADKVVVADTGVGIAEHDIDSIFTAFYRSDAVKDDAAGQGLGLALVRRLCNQLGWRISVSSQLGQGSRFEMRFA